MAASGIYIHIPFCRKKCSFCDFTAYAGQESKIPEYLEALFQEIKGASGTQGETIFFGGGTPSLLSAEDIGRILTCLRQNIKIQSEVECSLEAEPGTLTKEKLSGFRAQGVNRLSLGLQAWQNNLLKDIGRVHTREDFLNDFSDARNAGFDNINADLMFGLPGQRLEDWEETLREVISLSPEHISSYQLSIEEGTVFSKYSLREADEDLAADMFGRAIQMLKAAGYIHYEISNFARAARRLCRHNWNTWRHQPYRGFGAGAVSFNGRKRWKNETGLASYIRKAMLGENLACEEEILQEKVALSEKMILGLRLIEGLPVTKRLFNRFNLPIRRFLEEGLLERAEGNIRLSERGVFLGNLVFQDFL